MSARRILACLVLTLALGGASAAPALAAKAPLAPPQITSAVAVDTRTVDLTWTSVKGAHHYVVTSGVSPIYTTATTARVTDLYPGDEHVFFVSAETRKNQPLGTSEWVYVATPPEGPTGPLGWVDALDGYVRIWSGSGIGCVTQDLGILADEGTYTSLGDGVDQGGPRTWTIFQGQGSTETYAVAARAVAGSGRPGPSRRRSSPSPERGVRQVRTTCRRAAARSELGRGPLRRNRSEEVEPEPFGEVLGRQLAADAVAGSV